MFKKIREFINSPVCTTWLLYCLMLIVLQSCSMLFKKLNINRVEHNKKEVESLLLPYVLEYEKVCNTTVSIDIYFEKLKGNTVGVCRGFLMPRSMREISIDWEFFAFASEYDREALVFHELGHCDLDRFHESEILNDESIMLERPASLMHPYMFSDWTYRAYRTEYIKELCHQPEKLYTPFRDFGHHERH